MTDKVTEMKHDLDTLQEPKPTKELRESLLVVMDLALKAGGMQAKGHVDKLGAELSKVLNFEDR